MRLWVVQMTELRTLPQRVIEYCTAARTAPNPEPVRHTGWHTPPLDHHQRGDDEPSGGDMVHHGHQHVPMATRAEPRL